MDNKIEVTVDWMRKHYERLNAELFGGRLGDCDFGVFKKGRGSNGNVLGWFKITGRGVKYERSNGHMYIIDFWGDKEYVDYNNFPDICKPKIELNGNYKGTEKAFLDVLVHEMCHYYNYMYGYVPKQGHGKEFKEIAKIVASRSNGMFTVSRIANAETLNEMELDAEIKAKNEKRLENKKSKLYAIVLIFKDGEFRLSISSDRKLIDFIAESSRVDKRVSEIKISNDKSFIDYLFSKGYSRSFRKWRYWTLKPDVVEYIKQGNGIVWEGDENKPDDDVVNVKHDDIEKVEEPKVKRQGKFRLRASSGDVIITFNDEDELFNKIKERIPKLSDENIRRLMANKSSYINEGFSSLTERIISEVIGEYVNERINEDGEGEGMISPDMNLGLASPYEME